MLFSERIKELRMQYKLPQRHLAAALDIDTATYCKIEKEKEKLKENRCASCRGYFMLSKKT